MNQLTEAHWHTMKELVVNAAKFHASAEEALQNFVLAYLEQHPLSVEQKETLVDAIQVGASLCCENGRKTLSCIVDPIWAQELNEWAYDALGCKSDQYLKEIYLTRLKKKLEE